MEKLVCWGQVVMLSLQGFVRCMEDADPTRIWGYKSTGAVISNISCFAKVQEDSCQWTGGKVSSGTWEEQ